MSKNQKYGLSKFQGFQYHAYKLRIIKRLGQVYLSTTAETLFLIFAGTFGGKEDDAYILHPGQAMNLTGCFEAIHFGHHDIQYDEMGMKVLGHLQGFPPVKSFSNLKGLLLHEKSDGCDDIGFVVHD